MAIAAMREGLKRLHRRLRDTVWSTPAAAQDRRWYRVHVASVWLVLISTAAGVLLPRLVRPTALVDVLLHGLAPFLLSFALALVITGRVCAMLYDRPLRRDAVGRSVLVRHPLLTFLLAATLHLSTGASVEVLVLTSASAPWWIRVLTWAVVLGTAVPAWLMVWHPVQIWCAADVARGPRPTWRHRIRTWAAGVRAQGRVLATPVRELWAELRRRRTAAGSPHPDATTPTATVPTERPDLRVIR